MFVYVQASARSGRVSFSFFAFVTVRVAHASLCTRTHLKVGDRAEVLLDTAEDRPTGLPAARSEVTAVGPPQPEKAEKKKQEEETKKASLKSKSSAGSCNVMIGFLSLPFLSTPNQRTRCSRRLET